MSLPNFKSTPKNVSCRVGNLAIELIKTKLVLILFVIAETHKLFRLSPVEALMPCKKMWIAHAVAKMKPVICQVRTE